MAGVPADFPYLLPPPTGASYAQQLAYLIALSEYNDRTFTNVRDQLGTAYIAGWTAQDWAVARQFNVPDFSKLQIPYSFQTKPQAFPRPTALVQLSRQQVAQLVNQARQSFHASQTQGVSVLMGLLTVLSPIATSYLAGLVSEALGPTSTIGKLVGASTGTGVATTGTETSVTSALSAAKGATAAATSVASATTTGILSDLKSVVATPLTSVASTTASIASAITKDVSAASSTLKSILDPITSTIDSITGVARSIEDNLITPIVTPIETLINQGQNLYKQVTSDLSQGLSGMLKIPGQIADALTSTDAAFHRATQELGLATRSTAEQVVVPGLTKGIGEPIGQFHQAFKVTGAVQEHASATYTPLDRLTQHSGEVNTEIGADISAVAEALGLGDVTDPVQLIHAVQEAVKNADHWYLEPVRWAWNLLILGEFVAQDIRQSVEAAGQLAKKATPITLLGPAETIEALRRNILSPSDAEEELLRQGIDPSRQQALYDLAEFLFSPREAVELERRGIIGPNQYETLLAQNNLTPDQGHALYELLQKVLTAGEVASAYWRGFISQAERDSEYKAAGIPDKLMELVTRLSLSPLPPDLLVRLSGRQAALTDGLLTESLGQEAPADVRELFQQAQADPRQADLAWLAHWDVPGPNWWVQALFRSLRTRSEVYEAFKARNIPKELWDDIIATEEELPPVWLVPDVVASGVWSKEQAVPALMKLGFSEENATVLFNYGMSKSKTSKATTAADLAKVSLGNAKTLFDDDIITQQEYVEILLAHKYSQAAADLTAELAAFEKDSTKRKNYADMLLAQVRLGQMTKSEAESDLFANGFTPGEVAKYLQQIEQAKLIHGKLPSEAKLDDMLKKSIITPEVWLETMQLLGYSLTWSERLLQLNGYTPPANP